MEPFHVARTRTTGRAAESAQCESSAWADLEGKVEEESERVVGPARVHRLPLSVHFDESLPAVRELLQG